MFRELKSRSKRLTELSRDVTGATTWFHGLHECSVRFHERFISLTGVWRHFRGFQGVSRGPKGSTGFLACYEASEAFQGITGTFQGCPSGL